MHTLSSAAKECLTKSGWSQDYRADIVESRQILETAGYLVHDQAAKFLTRYGGLCVWYAYHPGSKIVSEVTDGFVTEVDDLIEEWEEAKGWIQPLERQLESRLCPIGHYLGSTADLVMAVDGSVYGVGGGITHLVGEGPEIALENLCRFRFKKLRIKQE